MVPEQNPFVEDGQAALGHHARRMTLPDATLSEPPRKRPALAIIFGLAILGIVGALIIDWAYTQPRLGTVVACRNCGQVPRAVDPGWVEVRADEAMAVSMGSGAGFVVKGPARFAVPGKRRVAVSQGPVFLFQGAGEPVIALLPQNASAGVAGPSVATRGSGTLLAVVASAVGNSIQVQAGSALAKVGGEDRNLVAPDAWRSGTPPAAPALDDEERGWLAQLGGL